MHRFADISTVEAFLNELAEREAGALVVELPRAPGTRETRWMQLLSEAAPATEAATNAAPAPGVDVAALANEVALLRDEVAALRLEVEALKRERPP
jgi:uncharacterized protein YceH (UPF0502 family)